MKNRITVFLISVAILFSLCAGAINTAAAGYVDTQRPSLLSLHYVRDGIGYDGLEIQIFRVADVFADGTYALTGPFGAYPVNIYGITSQTEWRNVASTLSSYIAADGIAPTAVGVTNEYGNVVFSNLTPGMYLTLSAVAHGDGKVVVFETFLSVLPRPSDDRSLNYNVSAYPKSSEYSLENDEKEYKVIKLWKDNGNADIRPKSVTVEIYKDGVLDRTQILSSENNWTYSWTAPDDGSDWRAVERDVNDNYTVTVSKQGDTIVITNIYKSEPDEEPEHEYVPDENPKTGDTTPVWLYSMIMCASGGILLMLAFWRKREEQEHNE